MAEEMDDRFSHLANDPRFRTLRKSDKKIKVDKRFSKMFTENRFKLKSSVDKRGKQINDNNSEDYKKFYNLSDSEKEDKEEEECNESLQSIGSKTLKKPNIPNPRGIDSDEDNEENWSSSESEDSDESEELDHNWNEWDRDVAKTESSTKRLAICNLDWDRINANDLFVLLNSFKPSGGSIISVRIFPSELGLQRMKAESVSGPLQFLKNDTNNKSNDINTEDDGEEIKDPKLIEDLRQYEMTRLKYFYAVVECDTSLTAEALYNELDGMEYESSSTALDLRFIDDNINFDETPKSECFSLPQMSSYKAPQFINSALQQSKVRMTWDQTDPKRKEIFERAFNKEDDFDDLKAYLASSDDEEEEEEEDLEINKLDSSNDLILKTNDKINKYKNLLNSLNDTKEDPNEGNLEITWEPNLNNISEDIDKRERNKDMSAFEQNHNKMKEKQKQLKNDNSKNEELDSQQNTQKHKEKRKRKTKNSNQEKDPNLELLFMDSSDASDRKHFNYKNIINNELDSKKRKLNSSDSFKFNADDPRFGAVYTSHHFNVDPSDPHFKKTEAFEQIMNRNVDKIKSNELKDNISSDNEIKSNNNWTQIVRKVKNKSQLIHKKPKFHITTQNKFKS